jgi:hypothetical protein
VAVVANAQDEKLVAEAKKEGRVAVYGSMETNTSMTFRRRLKRKQVSRLNIGEPLAPQCWIV